jgi:exonuclease III
MKGIFWNIRGLNMPGRKLSLEALIRDHRVDFVGVQETKKGRVFSCVSENFDMPFYFCMRVSA